MTEVVTSIKRVTDIMGEISAASNEQSAGVSQVGEAVMQMDQATQQNAALVEQMAAAASSLKSQAQELVQVVAAFKIEEGSYNKPKALTSFSAPKAALPRSTVAKPPAPKPVSKPLNQPKLAAAAPARITPKGGDDDWETF